MKIDCATQELSQGMKTVQAALSSRTTLPILLNVLVEADKDGLKMTSTDLTMGVRHGLKAKVGKEGSITIPAKKFAEVISTLPQDGTVKMSLGDSGKFTVRCGRSRFVLNGTPKSEFPALPAFDAKKSFTAAAGDFADMLRRTAFASSKDETRYVLNGVLWKAKDGKLEMAATDGRRMATLVCDGIPKENEFKVIVPNKFAIEALSQLSGLDPKDSIEICVEGTNLVAIRYKDTVMTSRLVEGEFPNYEQVIPTETPIQVIFEKQNLITILRQASLAVDPRAGKVVFKITKGKVEVHAQSQTMEFDDEIAVEYEGDGELEICFNPVYLLEGLKAFPTEKIRGGFSTETNPTLFTPEGQSFGDYKYVVMPMQK